MFVVNKHVIRKCVFILFAFVIIQETICAQEADVKKDSIRVYKDIESYSGKRKFTKFIYQLLFKPVPEKKPAKATKKKSRKNDVNSYYQSFEGKVIRSIRIETMDPFGYSLKDTLVFPKTFLFKTGNRLHVRSQQITIRNLLLIKENQLFDSLLVRESERLLRSMSYIHDVAFTVTSVSPSSDSVDIYIHEMDNWSLIPGVAVTPALVRVKLSDNNLAGLGHESKSGYTWYTERGSGAFNTSYFIPNFKNTYINSTLQYNLDENKNYSSGISVDRPFFSPFAKWAAGISFNRQFRNDSIYNNELAYIQQNYKQNILDCWGGNAIQIFKGNTVDDRSTSFISALRFQRIHFVEKPADWLDSLHVYTNTNNYLGTIGIATRKYIKDNYIFRFGVVEDVPVGRVYALTGGYQERNGSGRTYIGARVSAGNYFSLGYLSSECEYGSFFTSGRPNQGVFSAGIIYFTGLIEAGQWKFRQFVKPRISIGINSLESDSLTLKEGYGLDGFNSSGLSGDSRLLFTLQTQSYAPWDWIGFRFGPFLSYSMGMLGEASEGFNGSRIYSQLSLGVLIKNENLIISTFQFSISFYPSIPGNGEDIFKYNTFKTTDLSLKDFEMGRPAIVPLR